MREPYAIMGNCASGLTCEIPDRPVQSDPDVAGIGVRLPKL